MAKHSRALARRSNVIVVSAPRRGRIRRAARAVGRGVRHVARNRGGRKQLPVMGLGIMSAVVGWATAKGYLDKLPPIGGSRPVTLGIAGFLAQRYSRNHWVQEAGVAAVVAAAFDLGKVQGGGVSGMEDHMLGYDAGHGQAGGG